MTQKSFTNKKPVLTGHKTKVKRTKSKFARPFSKKGAGKRG